MDSSTYEDHIMSLSVADIRAIAFIRHYDDDEVDLSEEAMPAEIIKLCINTLNSDHITPEEQSLGFYTRKKLKRLTNWNEWKAGETKQIKQFNEQGMFGDPIDPSVLPLPDGAVTLRPHWQYSVKRSGVRRSRMCANGSKQAAPTLHAVASTWSFLCGTSYTTFIPRYICCFELDYLWG